MRKKICVVTGNRSEYGLFRPLIVKIKADKVFDLKLLVTGAHLSPEFGTTLKEIVNDGYRISGKVDIRLDKDTEVGICRSIGIGVTGFSKVLKRLSPDCIILLGDRFETFACAIAAHVLRIPICHIHGGELTEGALDDAFRHSITKMSVLHFPSTEVYRRRIIQLGELPNSVFNVGALGIDNIMNLKLFKKDELEKQLGFTFKKRNILVTFHPVTLENNSAGAQFKELLKAIDNFDDLGVIFTKPNPDAGNREISKLIDAYVRKNLHKAASFDSLGILRYLSTMQFVNAVVGNSSSGIIEAPSLGRPSVNIGDRQKGRIKPDSVINCAPTEEEITLALKKAFSSKFADFCKTVRNQYGDGHAAGRISRVIKNRIFGLSAVKKSFCDIRSI